MRRYLLVVAAALVGLPGAAEALEVRAAERAKEGNAQIFGIPVDSLSAGLGYGNWTGEAAPDIAPGFGWNVALDLDATRPVDLEVRYQGNVNSIAASGLEEFNIYNNQIAASAQVQPVRVGEVEPFVSGGIGLARASLAKNPDLNTEFQSDTMGVIPLAAGAQYDLTDNLVLGAHAHLDVLFDNEILTQEETTDSDRWGIMINLGATNF
mgnify:CR=1 FL=1